MKEFRKWAEKEGCDVNRQTNDSWEIGIVEGIEKGWRAAVEWMLKGLDYSIEHKEIADKLHKELEK